MNNFHSSQTRMLWALLCGGILALLWFAPAQWLAQAVAMMAAQWREMKAKAKT